MSSLTDPLDLQSRLTPPDKRLDPVPLLDILLIAVLMISLSSRFLYAPGLTIDLEGNTPGQPAWTLDLPTASQGIMPGQPTTATLTVAVLTARQENMFLFDGQIHTLPSLQATLRAAGGTQRYQNGVLLLKLDRAVSTQTFLTLCELAQEAGFSRIQLAAGNGLDREKP
jgi:biopolymer transport protein ExbD